VQGPRLGGQAGEEAEVGGRAGLESEGQDSRVEAPDEGSEGGEALRGKEGRIAGIGGGRKGLRLRHARLWSGMRDIEGLAVGVAAG